MVILGAGFGGLTAAKKLKNAPVRITLIDKNNYRLFQPLLYQVAIAALVPSQVAFPVRTIFRNQKNLTFQMGEVNEINLDEKYVKLDGSIIAYDHLIVAAGGRMNFFGVESVEQNEFYIKNIESASSSASATRAANSTPFPASRVAIASWWKTPSVSPASVCRTCRAPKASRR